MPRFNLKATLIAICTVVSTANLQAADMGDINDRISLQMYTLRNVGDTENQLAMANNAGFSNVELVGNQGLDASKLKTLLDKYDLKVSSAHVQLADLEHDFTETVSFNKAIGNNVVIVPWLSVEQRPTTADGWIAFGKKLDKLGRRLKKESMTLAYHNHNFEMKKYGNKTAMDLILENSTPSNLLVEIDVAWVSRGGQDPAKIIKKYKNRVFAIHAKDNAAIGTRDNEMNFSPLGEGLLDWDTIIPAAEKENVKFYVVEHDAPIDPYAIITTSLKNLKEKLTKHKH
ncbi:sugar phosphate isomerase/epimerase family protein [Aeromonas caviae]|uniref:sugar phosphate isomerase/epimerase family protein n=1 Tax=Aeromonas caviae TaxID=648 RepID=UPI002B4958E4|nr:sugar phosphate isomerase/epimerase [Aeromonas caviae]